jgi:hypothetical protein
MVERFVQYVLVGGVLLLAGLWTPELVPEYAFVGYAVAFVGALSLAVGIERELDY